MALRKVYGGTTVGTESRCETCSYARIIKGYAFNEKVVMCDRVWDSPLPITFIVAECTDYQDKRVPRLYDLEEIALPIEIKGRSAGFANASKENGSRSAGFVPGEAASLQEQDED